MVGENIKNYLNEKGIKQTFLVEKTGFSHSCISDICLGNRKIAVEEYAKICKALGVSLDTFLDSEQKG